MMTYLKENFLEKHHQIFILFLIFFLIRQGTSCELTKVLSCPDTKQKWDIAALKKNCSSNSNCSDYHCVPTETNQTVEVCAKPLYLQGVCPFFDTVGQKLQMTEIKYVFHPIRNRYQELQVFIRLASGSIPGYDTSQSYL